MLEKLAYKMQEYGCDKLHLNKIDPYLSIGILNGYIFRHIHHVLRSHGDIHKAITETSSTLEFSLRPFISVSGERRSESMKEIDILYSFEINAFLKGLLAEREGYMPYFNNTTLEEDHRTQLSMLVSYIGYKYMKGEVNGDDTTLVDTIQSYFELVKEAIDIFLKKEINNSLDLLQSAYFYLQEWLFYAREVLPHYLFENMNIMNDAIFDRLNQKCSEVERYMFTLDVPEEIYTKDQPEQIYNNTNYYICRVMFMLSFDVPLYEETKDSVRDIKDSLIELVQDLTREHDCRTVLVAMRSPLFDLTDRLCKHYNQNINSKPEVTYWNTSAMGISTLEHLMVLLNYVDDSVYNMIKHQKLTLMNVKFTLGPAFNSYNYMDKDSFLKEKLANRLCIIMEEILDHVSSRTKFSSKAVEIQEYLAPRLTTLRGNKTEALLEF